MAHSDLPPDFVEFLSLIKGKRAKIVVNHILEHGHITTAEIETLYGYKHPPRAVRDVREQGVPIETFNVQASDGRTIAAYRFGDPNDLQRDRIGGRYTIPKHFINSLIDHYHSTCAICNMKFQPRFLQVDHRVPYEVAGDVMSHQREMDDYMLACRACNRAKSWTCEHCQNVADKAVGTCQRCYWASPLQ